MPFIDVSGQSSQQQIGNTMQTSTPTSRVSPPPVFSESVHQSATIPVSVAPSLQQNVGNTVTMPNVVEVKGPDFPVLQSPVIPNPTPVAPGSPISTTSLETQYSPKTTEITAFLSLTENRNASDLHFAVGYPPILRVDGKLERICPEPLDEDSAERLFKGLVTEEQWKKYLNNRELDFSLQHKTGSRFRVNLFFDKGAMAGAFRLIPSKIHTIEELGLPGILNDFTKLPHGLVLVTGPTGSGKSTTLAGMLNEINMNYPKHIITIEDPIEYIYGKGLALMNQRELEKDTLSWQNALKYALRQDPDVVLVGEMRDFETISATITVAETGHLVFATLHTNSAAQTVDRIIDVFPEHQQAQIRAQLATVLQGIVSQRLVPMINGGRKAVNEVLVGVASVRNAIREGKTYQIDNMIQTGADQGMIPLEKSLAELIRKGEVSLETALEFTSKPTELKNLLNVA